MKPPAATFTFVLFLASSLSPELARAESCCDRARAEGKTCTHPCCVAAAKKHTICFKCNPDKMTCCDKAVAAGGSCTHPCCAAAGKVGFICTRCNPGRSVALFDGKSLAHWITTGTQDRKDKAKWVVGGAALHPEHSDQLKVTPGGDALVNRLAGGHGRDIYSEAEFGDARIELEVMVPKGSNSGIYLMGRYEIQILDSYGRNQLGMGDMGAVYGAAAPPINASKPPGEWQQYVIDVRAPRFDAEGKKTANARLVKVTLNGKVLYENLELRDRTPGGLPGKESPTGPLLFQGDHGEVAFRNIYVTPAPAS